MNQAKKSKFRTEFYALVRKAPVFGAPDAWDVPLSITVEVMLDTAKPMFLLWGPGKNILFNESFSKVLGRNWRKSFGASAPSVWTKSWPTLEPFASAAYEGRGTMAEDLPIARFVTRLPHTRYYTFSFTPIRDKGRVLGSVTLCSDTTQKILALKRLKSERQSVFRLFEDAPSFIAIVSGPHHRFIFTNGAYLRLIGRSAAIGHTVRGLLPELAGQEFLEALDQVYASGQRYTADRALIKIVHGIRSECTERYVSFVYEPMRDMEGAIIGIFAEGHDTTDQVLAEEKVRLLQTELVHIARVSAMGSMASTLAHELNQPLAAANAYLAASRKLLREGGDREDVAGALGEASDSVLRAGAIIRSIREFTERGEVKQDRVILEDVVREAWELAGMATCLDVELDTSYTAGLAVNGDAIQLQQVVLNFIRNACDAVRGQDRKLVSISTYVWEGRAFVSVIDNGPGIPADALPSLFGAFFSTKTDGMGVGLSISRTIIEAHGGEIWGANRQEGGAKFSFSLPAHGFGVVKPRDQAAS